MQPIWFICLLRIKRSSTYPYPHLSYNYQKRSELIRHHKKSQSRGKGKKGKTNDSSEPEGEFFSKVGIFIFVNISGAICFDARFKVWSVANLASLPAKGLLKGVYSNFRVVKSTAIRILTFTARARRRLRMFHIKRARFTRITWTFPMDFRTCITNNVDGFHV